MQFPYTKHARWPVLFAGCPENGRLPYTSDIARWLVANSASDLRVAALRLRLDAVGDANAQLDGVETVKSSLDDIGNRQFRHREKSVFAKI
jgi:hypothetical protein